VVAAGSRSIIAFISSRIDISGSPNPGYYPAKGGEIFDRPLLITFFYKFSGKQKSPL